MRHFIEAILLPPAGALLLGGLGALLWCFGRTAARKAGQRCVALAVAYILLASNPFVSAALLRLHQDTPPLPAQGDLPSADAIVVLGADILPWADDYGGATLGELTLARVRYAANLARRSELPVLTSGGVMHWHTLPLARLMALALVDEFQIPVRWQEGQSQSTAANAFWSAGILKADGIDRILLVTHAWHIPRARRAFERMGIEVVAAPTAFRVWPVTRWVSFVPSAGALQETRWALHEAIGRLWYWVHGFPEPPDE